MLTPVNGETSVEVEYAGDPGLGKVEANLQLTVGAVAQGVRRNDVAGVVVKRKHDVELRP